VRSTCPCGHDATTGRNDTVELNELDQTERKVLAAALKMTVLADGRASDDEARAIDAIVSRVGQRAWDEAMEAVADVDGAALRSMLDSVTRREAQELILGTVLEAATSDAVTTGEDPLIEEMSLAWGIQMQIDPPPDVPETP
jgi:hypothetical protein